MKRTDAISNKNLPIFKMAGILLLLYFIIFTVSCLVALNDKRGEITTIGVISLVTNIIFSILIVLIGLIIRRAFYIHLIFVCAGFNLLIPLIDAVSNFRSDANFVSLFILFLAMNIIYSYRSTTRRIYQPDNPIEKFGRLDREQAYWNLEKHFFGDEHNARAPWVSVILSIGPILGTFLYRGFPNEINLIGTILCSFIACILAQVPGIHLAVLSYLVYTEKLIEKPIQV